jgi:hypothetical protein
MSADPALRVLLTLILVCLLLLVAQGFGMGRGEGQGPYRVSVIKSGKPWLMRVNTDTGQVERLQLKARDPRWVALGEMEIDLADLEEGAAAGTESDEGPAGSFAPRPRAADAPLEVAPEAELEALVEALQPDNPREIRAWAAGILGSYAAEAPERSVPVLIGALDDPDPAVVVAAARSLGRSGDPGALPALRRLEGHSDAEVQTAAREAVANLE